MTDTEKAAVKSLEERGFPNTAKYVEMFGLNFCPSFRGVNKEAEEFYKNCVDEGHPWDWYFEFPEDSIF